MWENAFGNTIADIPLNQNPGRTIQLPSIEFNSIGDNYGSRMRCFICPPQTGNYIFYIAGDDAAELWLSTDDNPANKIRIASLATYTGFREWDRFPTQKSRAITLNAGTKYYIEVLQKEALGGDHVSVAWQLPDGTMDAPIKGNYVVPFVNTTTLANQTISFPTISVKGVNDPPFLINATASSGLPVSLVIVSGPATLLNRTLTITGVGTVIIEASQAGNSEYNPAPVVRQSFDVVVTPPPVCLFCYGRYFL